MKATRTITKRGNAEMVDCYCGPRQEWTANGGSILLETRLQGEHIGYTFNVEMSPYEARYFAMEMLRLLDSMQNTLKAPKTYQRE